MRMSQLFSQTLREAPTDAEIASHQLLIRAGFIRQLAAGIFTAMPLAKRTMTKIENILREEMNAIGGQEISMPVVQPAEIWQESGRWYKIGTELGRFKDKNNRDMVLAMTHEEVVADLTRREIHSYRQLPQLIYHLQTKWRDDPRPRAGLIRVREFTMKDSYSLDTDWDGLDVQYRKHYQSYFNIFARCGLSVIAVQSDVGMMGGKLAHEFMYLSPIGEDTLFLCDHCGYAANRQIADFRKLAAEKEELKDIEKVATPGTATIADLAEFLGIPKSKTSKAVFMIASEQQGDENVNKFVFAILRGDMDLNETKLSNAINAAELRPATAEEIEAVGAVPGYASPVGIPKTNDYLPIITVVDDLIPESTNLVAGANDAGYHLLNVNYPRDYQADVIADITSAQEGEACLECGNPLHSKRGIEVGNIFKLGTWFSEEMDVTYQDKDGKDKPVVMGSYGIGVGRLLASVAEEYHDDYGLILPITIAPYHVYMVVLPDKKQEGVVQETAEKLYQDLTEAGLEVILDDRDESPGVKFNDADLIGIPMRLTVSGRSLKENSVEYKARNQSEKRLILLDHVLEEILTEKAVLEQEILSRIKEVSLDE